MAIRSLKSGSFSRSTQVGNSIILPGDYESIATVTVGSGGSSTITFSSIPSTFKHLQIRALARTATGSTGQDDLTITLNSDTTNNYWWHRFGGQGTGTITGSAGALTSSNQFQELVARDGQNANVFSTFVIDILDYTNTNKYKTMRCLGGNDNNGSGAIVLDSAMWNSTSAISSISFTSGSSFKQYSHFALYGIRG